MTRLRGIMRARVARRIVWLFILSAIGPVTLMGVISFRAVNGQLEAHSRERLSQLAKNAGQSVLQQILLAENALRSARAGVAAGLDDARIVSSAPSVAHVTIVDSLGRSKDADWASRTVSATADELARLSRDEMILKRPTEDRDGLYMALPLDPDTPSAGLLWAQLRGDSIWAAAETFVTLPTVVDFCVLAAPSRAMHCTSGTERLPRAFAALANPGVERTFASTDGEAGLLVGQWSFYPDRDFASPPWTVMVAETTDTVFAPLDVFSTTFGLALVLAVLLVGLLSTVQIRRTLEPLRALETGTKRIAGGDLATRIESSSNDEFGTLAGSFNAMATELGAQFTQFEAIQAVGRAALDAFDRDEVVVTALTELPRVSGCSSAAVLLAADGAATGELVWLTGDRALGGTSVALTTEDHEWLRAHRHHGVGAAGAPPLFRAARRGLGPGELVAFPHVINGSAHGATLLEFRRSEGLPSVEVAGRVRQISDQVAMALDDVRLVRELEDMSWGALVALARAIDAKSKWTAGHSERVTGMAMALAREMGLPREELDVLHRGGLLHDVGKIGVPNSVLDKRGALTLDEVALIRQHPTIGARILAPIAAFAPAIPLVLHHHERWDGTGYPDGLAGEEIHPLTRILTVADAFDAIASARPYRGGRPEAVVLAALVEDSGVHFDPAVIDALVRLMADKGTFYPGELSRITA